MGVQQPTRQDDRSEEASGVTKDPARVGEYRLPCSGLRGEPDRAGPEGSHEGTGDDCEAGSSGGVERAGSPSAVQEAATGVCVENFERDDGETGKPPGKSVTAGSYEVRNITETNHRVSFLIRSDFVGIMCNGRHY